MSHRIRLGAPWEVSEAPGGTQHVRRFGRPRTLDATEQVWLVCESLPGGSHVEINGASLGTPSGGPFSADITSVLKPRNELRIVVPTSAPIGEAALEIRG